ncbi:MAG TPA: hypothetical protein VK989_09150 [Polyangia bacterium]|jgi:hypothetical protein|nr:hypothetical protein [Polyangia bacterium]
MKKRFLGSVVAATLALVFTSGAALAAVEEVGGNVPPVSDAPMGQVAVRRGVQGPEGLVTLRLLLLVDASKDAFGKPTSLAPDLYYSLSDTVQIGLLHTLPMGWQTEPGAGLCLTGKSKGCPHFYDNVGFDLMYGLVYGDFHLSLHSSLYFFHIADPLGTMWTVGLTGKLHFTDAVALFFDPQIGIELSNRDVYKDQLFIPLELQFQAAPAVSIKVLSGVTGQLSALGDTVRSPLGLGVVANLTPHLDLGVRFSFDNLLGHQAPMESRTDERSIGVLLNVRS